MAKLVPALVPLLVSWAALVLATQGTVGQPSSSASAPTGSAVFGHEAALVGGLGLQLEKGEASERLDVVDSQAAAAPSGARDTAGVEGVLPEESRRVRISGRALNEAGLPVAGRALTFDLLSENGIKRSRRGWEIGEIDDEGRFLLEGPATELGAVVLRGGRGAGVLVNRVLAPESAEGVVWVQQSQVLVRGQVFGSGAGGQAEVQVYESPSGSKRSTSVTVQAGGTFELAVANQRARLGVCVRSEAGKGFTIELRPLWRELGESRGGVVELGGLDMSEDAARVGEWLLEQRELKRERAAAPVEVRSGAEGGAAARQASKTLSRAACSLETRLGCVA